MTSFVGLRMDVCVLVSGGCTAAVEEPCSPSGSENVVIDVAFGSGLGHTGTARGGTWGDGGGLLLT